jgi:hypothetical protein
VPRPKPPELTSPAERRRIAARAADLNYEPALEVLGIVPGDRRWDRARDMLQQVAANYLVARAAMDEETPARQIATLKDALKGMKARAKQGMDPSPFSAHPCDVEKSQLKPLPMEQEKALASQKPRHEAGLPMALEMRIARELPATQLATPELSMGVKQVAATHAAIARLDANRRNSEGKASTGRPHPWPLVVMLDQLEAVAFEFAPLILAKRKRTRLWKFISNFMVDAMGMTRPDIEEHRSRADKLLPEVRAEHRRKMQETEQGQAAAARARETKKQNKQNLKLLRKLQGREA